MPDSSSEYYTSTQVAKMFGVHPNTVARWRKAGTISYIQINKRVYLYPKNKIKKLLPS